MSSKTDGAALRTFLSKLLESGEADAVFGLRSTPSEGRYVYSLVSDPALLEQVLVPFHPVMPVQGAKALTSLTSEEPSDRRIVALLRPCELRACVELSKQNQLSMDNVIVVSCSCPGVIPAEDAAGEAGSKLLEDYWRSVSAGEEPSGIRQTCTVCGSMVPENPVAMTWLLAADGGGETGAVHISVDWADARKDLLTSTGVRISAKPPPEAAGKILESRELNRVAFLEEPAFAEGLDGLVGHFSGCTGCGGCRAACPVCSCVLCTYVSDRNDLVGKVLDLELKARGAARVPSGTIRFHLGRLNHISAYCAGCGQCSDACPSGIDVAGLFVRAAGRVRKRTGYAAGADQAAEPFLATFCERELEDITD